MLLLADSVAGARLGACDSLASLDADDAAVGHAGGWEHVSHLSLIALAWTLPAVALAAGAAEGAASKDLITAFACADPRFFRNGAFADAADVAVRLLTRPAGGVPALCSAARATTALLCDATEALDKVQLWGLWSALGDRAIVFRVAKYSPLPPLFAALPIVWCSRGLGAAAAELTTSVEPFAGRRRVAGRTKGPGASVAAGAANNVQPPHPPPRPPRDADGGDAFHSARLRASSPGGAGGIFLSAKISSSGSPRMLRATCAVLAALARGAGGGVGGGRGGAASVRAQASIGAQSSASRASSSAALALAAALSTVATLCPLEGVHGAATATLAAADAVASLAARASAPPERGPRATLPRTPAALNGRLGPPSYASPRSPAQSLALTPAADQCVVVGLFQPVVVARAAETGRARATERAATDALAALARLQSGGGVLRGAGGAREKKWSLHCEWSAVPPVCPPAPLLAASRHAADTLGGGQCRVRAAREAIEGGEQVLRVFGGCK